MDTEDDGGRPSSSCLTCSSFRRIPPSIHGCAISPSYSVVRLIESMTVPSPSSRPPVPVRNTILYGCSSRTSALAAKSALTLRICPPAVSPRLAITGIEPALSAAWIGASCTRWTLPTSPSVAWST